MVQRARSQLFSHGLIEILSIMNKATPFSLADHGLIASEFYRNLSPSSLYEHAIRFEKREHRRDWDVLLCSPMSSARARGKSRESSLAPAPEKPPAATQTVAR
ncbi:MAG: hypothetical protein DME42_11855 [Verrucomicrobia bacterium]|nr:MAG: hypothetical protein DME42_11855 [Verrucomicrobiota bacterium]